MLARRFVPCWCSVAETGLQIVHQPDGMPAHWLVLVDAQPIGTIRSVDGGFSANSGEALFASFQTAVVYAAIVSSERARREAERIMNAVLHAIDAGPLQLPAVK